MAAIQPKPWHASTGETEGAKIMNTIHWRRAIPPQPQLETDFAARHHCAFWAAG
jgi:hypothetical protein